MEGLIYLNNLVWSMCPHEKGLLVSIYTNTHVLKTIKVVDTKCDEIKIVIKVTNQKFSPIGNYK